VNKYAPVSRVDRVNRSFKVQGVFDLSIFEYVVLKFGDFDV